MAVARPSCRRPDSGSRPDCDIHLVYQPWSPHRAPSSARDRRAASLGERAYYGIRELIVTLELAPVAPVSERELMERLGLGRTPVREALRTLAQEKLVEVYPRRGIVVSPRRRRRPRAPLGGANHARELRRAARRRAGERRRPRGRLRAPRRAGPPRRHARRAGADRARPAHPSPRLPLRAQPVRRVDAQRVLHADAADLVPRARPRRPARRRRHRARRPAAGDLRRRRALAPRP